MRGADIIAARLFEAGCRTAFGIPGGEVLALLDGLDRTDIRFILTKHENAAGFMAEGAWHASGAPGVLIATLGPGVANAVNVVANAWQDRVPMIFLTGCVDDAETATYTHQVFDHQALLRPIVKTTLRASPGAVGPAIDKALAIATDGQPGPVHLDVPIAVAETDHGEELPVTALFAPAARTTPTGEVLDDARKQLSDATRPLIVAGLDAVNDDASKELLGLAEHLGAPVIATYKAKGLLDDDHPLSMGGAGLSPRADTVLLPLVGRADAIVLAGYDPIEMRIGWRDPWSPDVPVIDVTPVLRDHGMHSVTHTLTGSIREGLQALVTERPSEASWPDGEPAAARIALEQAFAPEQEGWGPATIFATLRDSLPRNTVTTVDSGAHRILFSQMWQTHNPRSVLQSSALCTMGCALPLAIGYRVVGSDLPVAVIVGDACLEMVLGELATLRDLAVPLLLVVLADTSLALIEMKQRASQRPNVGVDFGATDFPALAHAFGGHGAWVDDAETLANECTAALDRNGFTLLACRLPRRAYDGKI